MWRCLLFSVIATELRGPDKESASGSATTRELAASSGNNVRHRLNTGGNRALNSVLHVIAVVQIRDGGHGQEYYQRKIAEGKTPSEARRALKRRLSNVVYRIMKRDRRTQLAAAA
ncbi:transposase [Kitasatospora sp. NPDC101235]|uniref:transposase n=1 Tax=Kitasatospora sp. NPDC101235 TaxID=3364101 RepID=UPI0038120038